MSVNMKGSRHQARNYRVEILLNNIIDNDLQTMLMPLNIMQLLTFCPKYRIKDNFVTPNGRVSNLLCLLGTLVFTVILVVRVNEAFESYVPQLFFVTQVFDTFTYFIGFVVNSFVGIKYSDYNVKLVLTIQDVHRSLNDVSEFKRTTIWSWIVTILVIGAYVVYFIYFQVKLTNTQVNIGTLILSVFDINIIYAIELIKLLKSKLVLWNIEVLKSQEFGKLDTKEYDHKIFELFVKIFEGYEMFKVSYNYVILYFLFNVFIHTLLYTGIVIKIIQDVSPKEYIPDTTLSAISIYIWLAKGILLQVLFTQHCEKFYKALENAQDACTVVLKSGCSEDKKRFYKNIQRLYRTSFRKISVSGFLYVDALMTANMVSTVTEYVIVLLQFIFL